MTLRAAAAAAFLAALVAAADRPAVAASRPRYGGSLVRGFVGEVANLDPRRAVSAVEREAARQLHATLYGYDEDGQPAPDLVAQAEVLPDGSEVRLQLRPAWFHDGRPVTAEDAAAALRGYAAGSPPGSLLGRPDGEPLVTVIGERTLVLRVAGAPVLWPWLLCDLGAAVVPARSGEPASGTVGAGPFRLASRDSDSGEIVLRAHQRHHRGRPLLDEVTYRPYPSDRALRFAMQHEGVDVIESRGRAEARAAVVGTHGEVVALWLNRGRPGLAGAETRQRLAAAVQIDALIDIVLAGDASRSAGLVTPRPVLSPARDRVVATAAATMPDRLSLLYPRSSGLDSVAARLRVDLAAIGVAVRLLPRRWGTLATELASGEFDLALVVIPAGTYPAAVQLIAATGMIASEAPAALVELAAAVDPWRGAGGLIYAAEAELLAAGELRVLFRRNRRLLAEPTIRDVRLTPDGTLALDDAWRWPRP